MIYRPCPSCGQPGTFAGAHLGKRYALFECAAGHLYATVTARNGLLLDTKILSESSA